MCREDGIQISGRPVWEESFSDLLAILGKRALSLPSKALGFKPLCLGVATWLLYRGLIRDWIWFAVMVVVLFGIVGLKALARYRGEV